MAEFLLIHGTSHGAWCWRDLIPVLTGMGHGARAIDLPGHGADPTPPGEVTLAACGQAVLAASTPETIVLGHSWGGFPISAAAEADPERMRALVYLAGYLPVSGMSLVEMRQRAPRQLIGGAVIQDPDGQTYRIDPKAAPGLFYHDCTPETVRFAVANLCPQAVAPQNDRIVLTDRFRSVPKTYIRCLDDRTIAPEFQIEMSRDLPPEDVYGLPTSHSPFFSDPDGLAAILNRIAERL